ncbi:Mannan endo-1,6-alpha-mannosidase [Purpureocillium lavendulum]|uniref:Mannan endo-1,6-alpha-mannosidase n=1 Tax=Purpureocillium lavendulum TaxID=1247861 RepID=A0AB34FVJ9_9HYPO|nr:Mannan endo-1,6-alpha-mannosidase [Purpureocillium lavendulum]
MGSEFGVHAGSKPEPTLGPVGIFWASWACVWTTLLVLGMAYLIARRKLPILRLRGLGISLAAITLLHLYWISVQLGYVVGVLAPGDAEYWIMGIYLPFGIALFHASNSRFLHVAQAQKKYAEQGGRAVEGRADSRRASGLLGRFKRLDYTAKMLAVVGMGMFVQLMLTILMYIISRKWHSSWGIPGTEVTGTEMEQKMEMGRGWEWWPSVFWQFLWAWIVAPVILWKSRGIHDTQGWRLQTIGCAVANLHATPMWLIALYVPGMEPVNKYFIPPQWIAVSIMLTEVFTVFLPCWEVMRHQTLRQETLDSIAQWESKNKVSKRAGNMGRSIHTASSTRVESIMSGWKSTNGSVKTNNSDESILTMSALEHVLERNPAPLQEFSALRDFSGENIAFLTSVAEWKNSLPQAVRDGDVKDVNTRELVRERFNRALRIYAGFISTRDAEFPINISSHDLKKLEGIFEASARMLYGEKRDVDPATPFDFPAPPVTRAMSSSSEGSEKTAAAASTTGITTAAQAVGDRVQFWGEIPDEFDETVFDDAEKSIKYLVLTNTWPKFVRNRRSSMDTLDPESNTEVVQLVKERTGK